MPQTGYKVQSSQPSAFSQNSPVPARSSPHGDAAIIEILRGIQGAAWEGSLFISRPAPAAGGSGTAMGIQTSFSDTANIALMLNNGDSQKFYIPVYIKTRCTAAGQTTTSSEIAIEVDASNRYSSGGSNMPIGKVNPYSASPGSNATARVGVITANAAGTRYWVNSFLIRSAAAPAWIVGDVDWYVFGLDGVVAPSKLGQPIDTTASPGNIFNWPLLPLAVPPGGTMLVHIANVANATTAPSFEWELAWIERA